MNKYTRSIHSSSEMVEPVTLSTWRASHWPLLSLLLIATVLIGLSVGRYSVALDEIVAILYAALRGDNSQHMDALVILNVRLPRILLAGVCGAGLAICVLCNRSKKKEQYGNFM